MTPTHALTLANLSLFPFPTSISQSELSFVTELGEGASERQVPHSSKQPLRFSPSRDVSVSTSQT